MYFIFERSKTPERKKGQNYNNEIFNLFKVTKKISIFTLKKFKQIKFLHAISLNPVFFKSLLSSFLAFSSSLLALFYFLVCDNLFLSFSTFKSLARLSIMYFFNYIFIFWMSELQVIKIESLINWLINLKYFSQSMCRKFWTFMRTKKI